MDECVISQVLVRPVDRPLYVKDLMRYNGIGDIKEDPNACYCAQPLTDLNILMKQFSVYNFIGAKAAMEVDLQMIKSWHDSVKDCLHKASIATYDPGEVTNPKDLILNPQITPAQGPREVSDIDIGKVIECKLFEYTNLWGSTGSGIEEDTAVIYNKISYIITKKDRYSSRMGTGRRRTLVLAIDEMSKRQEQLVNFFRKTSVLEPGIGTCERHGNVLLLFEGDKPLCSDSYVQGRFPDLAFNFSDTLPK
jgi:hypothetical protein